MMAKECMAHGHCSYEKTCNLDYKPHSPCGIHILVLQACKFHSTLIRPPLLQWKSGLIIWEESLGGEGLVVFIIYEHLKSGPIRWVAFGRSDLIREGLLYLILCIETITYFGFS
jgi:hypothetical protein